MIALPRLSRNDSPLRHDSTFVTTSIGTMLIAKAAGFISQERAELLEVTENTIEIRIGSGWLRRLLSAPRRHPPLQIRLTFCDPPEEDRRVQAPVAPSKEVQATITPLGRWSPEEFERVARGTMWRLQSHFLAYTAPQSNQPSDVVSSMNDTNGIADSAEMQDRTTSASC